MSDTGRAPLPVAEDWDWQLMGACRDVDSDLFFHPYGERDPSRTRREQAAKSVCARCPVLQKCRDYALASAEPYGVWGGLSETERAAVLSRSARGWRTSIHAG